MKMFFTNVPSVLLISLVLLVNAQRTSNNLRDVDPQELARQNKITKQILEAFIQKKLGLRSNNIRTPSISDILPIKMQTEERNVRESDEKDLEEEEQEILEEIQEKETPEDDSLQSVETEQIDSVYDSDGMYI